MSDEPITIWMDETMLEEIWDRQEREDTRSSWVREAVRGRCRAEDAGEWDRYADGGPEDDDA